MASFLDQLSAGAKRGAPTGSSPERGKKEKTEMEAMFAKADKDGSGELDHEEFRRALTYMGVSLPVRSFLIFRWSSAGPPKN